MQAFYTILLILGVLVALLFSALVFLTGKGDAMSGGGGVRTTFTGGTQTFEEKISRITLILGISFMALMLTIDVLGNRMKRANDAGLTTPPAVAAPTPQTPTTPGPTPEGTTTSGAVPGGTAPSGTAPSGTVPGGAPPTDSAASGPAPTTPR